MANLRDIRRRIGSVKNTRQITRAMKMVAGAKLRRATERAVSARPYQVALTQVLQNVAGRAGADVSHPLLESPDTVETVLVVVISSDKGLCGSFNGNLLRKTEAHLEGLREQGRKVKLLTYGKKARVYFGGRDYDVVDAIIELTFENYLEEVGRLADLLTAGFGAGDFQEVQLAYNDFRSVMLQVPSFPRVLPLAVEDGDGEAAASASFTFEPDAQQLLNTLLPLYLQTLLHQAFLETEAGEHAARMTAMDAATRNAGELISDLTLQYNRARQAAITTEIIEIVSGAEAL